MNALTILHVTTAFRPHAVGGAEVVVTTLAHSQADAGHKVYITHLGPEPAPRYVEEGVTIIPLTHKNFYDIKTHASKPAVMRKLNKFYSWYNPGVLGEIGKLFEELRPDIVHTHSLVDLSTQIWQRASRRGVRVVHTLHDYDLLCRRATLFNGKNCAAAHNGCVPHKWIKQLSLQKVDAFVSISDFVTDEHERQNAFGPNERARTVTIWNPLAVPSSIGGAGTQAAAGGLLRLGFLGRLVPEKGVGLLIDELGYVNRPGKWALDVGGVSPTSDQWLREKAVGLPVTFAGWVKTDEFLRDLDVLIVPSLWNEPFGLTVIEGLLAGKVVIGSKRGAIPEILSGMDRDCLFDPDVPGDLARVIDRVIDAKEAHIPGAEYLNALTQRLHPRYVRAAYDRVYFDVLERAY